jgi:hypothetical protein
MTRRHARAKENLTVNKLTSQHHRANKKGKGKGLCRSIFVCFICKFLHAFWMIWLCSDAQSMFSCATAAACDRSVGNVAALSHISIGTHVSTEWPDDTREPKKTSPLTSWLRNITERTKRVKVKVFAVQFLFVLYVSFCMLFEWF